MNCLVKQFAMCLGVVSILLLNVMEVCGVGGGALLDKPLWSSKEYTCASKCSFHMFCLCFCMSEVISSFKCLRAGLQVFTLLMLSLV